MKGTQFDNSLLENRERNLLPVPIAPRGTLANFGQNSWYAYLCRLIEGAPSSMPMAQGYDLDVLIFGEDTPIIQAVYSHYGTATAPWAFTYWEFREPSILYTNLTGNLVITADSNNNKLEQQATGLTLTNQVRVAGHRVYCDIQDRNLLNIAAELPCAISLLCITKGAVVAGPERFYRAATEEYPIILQEAAYTQAMKDAGNVVVNGADTYKIVGLFGTAAKA